MSTRRLAMITTVPLPVKKAFRLADEPTCGEERLWRERAARMTLDALGHTNLTVKPHEHNAAVRYARRWFRGFYNDLEGDANDNAPATFDFAGIVFDDVKRVVLATDPIIFEPENDDEPGPAEDATGNRGTSED